MVDDAKTKMKGQQEMPPTKYGKYVTREIIAESKYPEITAPIARYNGCRGGGDALSAEWSCITTPLTMDQEPEVDAERDQFLLFGSSNVEDGADFQAEIELALGAKGRKLVITEPTCIYLPKGLWHGPVTFKNVKKPVAFLSWHLAPQLSTSWEAPDESDYVASILKTHGSLLDMMKRNSDEMPPDITAIHQPNIPFRHARMPMGRGIAYMLWSEDLGFPAKASWSCASGFYRDYCCLEPVHAHRRSHQVSMFLGGNPLNIEDFDVEIEASFGKEQERHTLSTPGVIHYVPGIPHIGDERRVVKKPFLHLMWVLGPEMNNYYKAAAVDKVVLSDESKGEPMITPGAMDYVPPTKMEDWVWPYPSKTE
jgi:hypothetical protein